jgi:hypothetical protein
MLKTKIIRAFIALTCALLIGTGIWWFLGPPNKSLPDARGDISKRNEMGSDAHMRKNDTPINFATSTQGNSTGKNLNPLLAEFKEARNLRVFVEKAKQQPQQGGLLLAKNAMLFCRSFAKLKSPAVKQEFKGDAANQNAANRAREQLVEMCTDFTSTELDSISELATNRAEDPALAAYTRIERNLKQGGSVEERLSDLNILYALGLISEAGRNAFSTQVPDVGSLPPKRVWYLEGKLNGGVSEIAFQRAFSAWERSVKDELSLPVNTPDLVLCMSKGICEGNGLELVMNDLPQDSKMRAEIKTTYERIKNAMTNANFRAFSAPQISG